MRLELKGIVKQFGSLVANDAVDLHVEGGEILSILGENGAGKSTLMNVASGMYRPDAGQILIDGEPVTFSGTRDAIAAGIGMVHQHFALIPVFTAAEAILLGAEPAKGPLGWVDRDAARATIEAKAGEFGLFINPDAIVEQQPVGVQQRIEIVRALVHDAQVLILDEPTAVLTPQETEQLFGVLRRLRDAGRAIVFISHKLAEVKAISDRIMVMRAGRVVGEADPKQATAADLATMMVGRQVILNVQKDAPQPRETALRLDHVSAIDDRGNVALNNVSFELRGGEILAVAGVEGNGQTELARVIYGLLPLADGAVYVNGKNVAGRTTREIAREGVGYIPEDRSHEGLATSLSLIDNLILDIHDEAPFSNGIWFNRRAARRNALERVKQFDIRASSVDLPVGALSGGNQQKVVLARELSRDLRVLIAAQPTRGVDVGSIETVHRRLVEQRDRGVAVLLISAELDEVQSLADRILVLYQGRVVGIVGPETDRSTLGLMMAGAPQPQEEVAV